MESLQTRTATFDTLQSVAEQLANEGYFITATGGTVANGLLLVGTRAQGDTVARPIMVVNTVAGGNGTSLSQQGYAMVGWFIKLNSDSTLAAYYEIGER